MWHNYDREYNLSLIKLKNAKVDEYEKKSIIDLTNKMLAGGLSKPRVIKYIVVLRVMLERGVKSYTDMREEDLYQLMIWIRHDWNLGFDAQRDYFTALKAILKYHGLNEFIGLIKSPKTKKKQDVSSTTLNIFDIMEMEKVCQNPRDRAIVTCLYESDTRPKEFFNLQWQDIQFEKVNVKMWDGNGCMVKQTIDIAYLRIDGKTGPRKPFIFFSVPYLLAWKKAYPRTPSNHVWIDLENELEQLKYPAARKILNTLARRCKLEKHITPYSFRHGRNTEVCEVLSYAQHCEYAGWRQGSDMPRVYNHISGLNMVAPILGEYGVVVERRQAIREAWIQLYRNGLKL